MIPNMIRFVNRLLRNKTMLRTFQMPLVVSEKKIFFKYIYTWSPVWDKFKLHGFDYQDLCRGLLDIATY